MRVTVIAAGRYNGTDHKAMDAETGDVIEVAGGGYGQSLIDDGMVELFQEPGPSETQEAAGPTQRKRARK